MQVQGLKERREKIAGMETFWLEAPTAPGNVPTLYVHGTIGSGDDFAPFLEKTGGAAIDLPGFGRSEKPMHFDGSLGGYNAFLQAFAAQQEWERFNLVVHDAGAIALITAQELHARINRFVLINALPLLPGYRYSGIARVWRWPIAGEFTMGLTTKSLMRRATRAGRPDEQELPEAMLDETWEHFDHGTQRAILKLYRGAPPKQLEEAGERFSLLTAPALVIHGEQDPWVDKSFAGRYAETLPHARLELLTDAGHWPWLDVPGVIDQVANFVAGVEDRA
jgi:pimeloyl-ACP methyl ester carboxylesterase